MSTVYSAAAVRGLVCTLVNIVFDEPVPLGTICPQEWRRGRLLDVIGEAFADEPRPPDGSMPWHDIVAHVLELDAKRRELLHEHGPHVARNLALRAVRSERMCPSPMCDGRVTVAQCVEAGECGCDEGLNQER